MGQLRVEGNPPAVRVDGAQITFGLATLLATRVVLLVTIMGTSAQCSRASFEVPCMCLNDETCVSQTVGEY